MGPDYSPQAGKPRNRKFGYLAISLFEKELALCSETTPASAKKDGPERHFVVPVFNAELIGARLSVTSAGK